MKNLHLSYNNWTLSDTQGLFKKEMKTSYLQINNYMNSHKKLVKTQFEYSKL